MPAQQPAGEAPTPNPRPHRSSLGTAAEAPAGSGEAAGSASSAPARPADQQAQLRRTAEALQRDAGLSEQLAARIAGSKSLAPQLRQPGKVPRKIAALRAGLGGPLADGVLQSCPYILVHGPKTVVERYKLLEQQLCSLGVCEVAVREAVLKHGDMLCRPPEWTVERLQAAARHAGCSIEVILIAESLVARRPSGHRTAYVSKTQRLQRAFGIPAAAARVAVRMSLTEAQLRGKMHAAAAALPVADLQAAGLPPPLSYWTDCYVGNPALLGFQPETIRDVLNAWSCILPGGRQQALELLGRVPSAWSMQADQVGRRFTSLCAVFVPTYPLMDSNAVTAVVQAMMQLDRHFPSIFQNPTAALHDRVDAWARVLPGGRQQSLQLLLHKPMALTVPVGPLASRLAALRGLLAQVRPSLAALDVVMCDFSLLKKDSSALQLEVKDLVNSLEGTKHSSWQAEWIALGPRDVAWAFANAESVAVRLKQVEDGIAPPGSRSLKLMTVLRMGESACEAHRLRS